MSAEVQESGGKRGKSKQKKITVRVQLVYVEPLPWRLAKVYA